MDSIGNKIVTIEKIVEIAKYFQEYKQKYIKLLEIDRSKNKDIPYDQQAFSYDGRDPKIEYTVYFIDGKTLTETNYDWFISMLKDKKFMKRINIDFDTFFSSTHIQNEKIYKRLKFSVNLDTEEYKDTINVGVRAENLEEEANKIRNEINSIISSCEERYNKTVKYHKIRIQSFCIAIGIVLSYLLYVILILNKDKLPETLAILIADKNILVFGQWVVAVILGNIVSYGIIYSMYKLILPKLKYDRYDTSSHKSIYKEDIKEYLEHSEIQIGKFCNSQQIRNNIEKIFKITWKIVLIQSVISILFYCIV